MSTTDGTAPPPSDPVSVTLADGARLRVRVRSDEPTDRRLPVVWGHGLSSSMASEDRVELINWTVVGAGRTVVRYDARGHGESDVITEPITGRWDQLAEDQSELVDHLGLDQYVAAGASMGCATALFAALARPDRVRALVLVIPPTAWETRREQVSMYLTMADLLDQGRIDLLLAGVDAAPVPDPLAGDTTWADRARETLLTTDSGRLAMAFRGAALADLPSVERLASLEQPALILSWTGDPGHPPATARQLADLLPRARWHEASSAADLGEWSGLVAAFLDEHGDPSDRRPGTG